MSLWSVGVGGNLPVDSAIFLGWFNMSVDGNSKID
jgi:hypothetical protein